MLIMSISEAAARSRNPALTALLRFFLAFNFGSRSPAQYGSVHEVPDISGQNNYFSCCHLCTNPLKPVDGFIKIDSCEKVRKKCKECEIWCASPLSERPY